MSIWRRKRRYEENRRFSERADDALLAIGLIRNSADGIETKRTDAELREKLSRGEELLQELQSALENPEQVDTYAVALAHRLCEQWQLVPEDAVDELAKDIQTIRKVRQTLSTTHGLSRTAETFEDIENIAARISESEAEQIQKQIVN
jgi:hypothetical protein